MAIEKKTEDTSFVTIELKKPISYNDKEYTELTFDFDALTGSDSLAIEDELMALGKSALVPALSSEYLIRFAAKACKEPIGSDIFLGMNIKDYQRVRNAAKNFLLNLE
ncbi:MAG: phage tail assembly protein [Ruminococcus sp.]|nr:phage tail assembly protein [Ruminococcus sp.]